MDSDLLSMVTLGSGICIGYFFLEEVRTSCMSKIDQNVADTVGIHNILNVTTV